MMTVNTWTKKISASVAAALLLAGLSVPSSADTVTPVPALVEKLTSLYNPGKLPQSATPVQQKDPLGHFLALQRQHYPQAFVSSTFYDYRTVSVYRRNAGLHLGYDIAMPYGSPVSVAWDGVVTSILPWTDTQYGVTVESPGGMSVTYGHIAPNVSVGQRVSAGQLIGYIRLDHVDIKMRDAAGRYVPFGENSDSSVALTTARPSVDRNTLLTAWLVAKSTYQQAEDELFYAENASKKDSLEKRSAQRRIEALDRTLEQIATADQEGLISRRRLEELKAERKDAQKDLSRVQNRKAATVAQLRTNLETGRANLKSVENWARSQGLKWSDVEALVKKTLASDQNLRAKVQEQKLAATGGQLTLDQLRTKVSAGKTRLQELEELYKSGGLSKAEIEDQRLKQQLLQEELHLRSQRK